VRPVRPAPTPLDFVTADVTDNGAAPWAAPFDPPPERLEVIDLPELLTRAFPPRQNLIGPALLIRQGLAVLGGSPRIGKSLLCLNLALCRALGRPWCGFALTPGVTVYIQAEIPEPRLQERVRLMLNGLGDPPPPAHRLLTITKRRVFVDQPAGRDALVRALDTLASSLPEPPDLLILDSLARFYSGEENSQRDVGRFVETLDGLVERFSVALLIPHHPSKPVEGDPKEGGAKLRGMSGLWAAADATWWLSRSHDGLSLSFEDLRHGEPPAPLYLERSPYLWLYPTDAPTDERLATVARAVLGIGLTWSKLRAAVIADLECSQASAERLINQAIKAGLIAKDDQGIYRQPSRNHQNGADGESTPPVGRCSMPFPQLSSPRGTKWRCRSRSRTGACSRSSEPTRPIGSVARTRSVAPLTSTR
jgi:hypothetical protein